MEASSPIFMERLFLRNTRNKKPGAPSGARNLRLLCEFSWATRDLYAPYTHDSNTGFQKLLSENWWRAYRASSRLIIVDSV